MVGHGRSVGRSVDKSVMVCKSLQTMFSFVACTCRYNDSDDKAPTKPGLVLGRDTKVQRSTKMHRGRKHVFTVEARCVERRGGSGSPRRATAKQAPWTIIYLSAATAAECTAWRLGLQSVCEVRAG